MAVQATLREQRRQASRAAFIEAARVLFEEPGFQHTTMSQIANHAGLHVQTLYTHFPTKQLLAATLHCERFRAALASRPGDTITFWQDWVHRAARSESSNDHGRSFLQFVVSGQSDPKVAGVKAEIAHDYIYDLADAIALDFGLDLETDRRPVLIANMLWGGNSDAVFRWSGSGGKIDLVNVVVTAAEEVAGIVRNYQEFVGFRRSP